MQNFHKLFLATLGLLVSPAAYAQLGVGTGSTAPRTMLDVNGALSFSETAATLTGANPAYTIAATVGQLQLSNASTAPTGTAALSSATSPTLVAGQQLLVFNNSSIPATLNGNVIPAGQTTAFVYSAGGWRASTGGGTIYTSDGTLAANRTVTQGSNALTFTGAGALTKLSGASGTASTISIGRTAAEGSLSTIATAAAGTPNTAAGDLGLFTGNTTANLVLGTPTSSTGYVGLGTAGSERLRISSAGYLGLGTTNPTSKLHLLTATSTGGVEDDIVSETYSGSYSSGSGFFFRHGRGTLASPTNLASGDEIFSIDGSGYINSSFTSSGFLRLNYVGSGTTNLSYMSLGTSAAERVRIDQSGNVGVGTSTPGSTLDVNGNANVSGATTIGGLTTLNGNLIINGKSLSYTNAFSYYSISSNGTATGYNTAGASNYSVYAVSRIAASEFDAFSDARLKNISGLSNNQADLESLKRIVVTNYTMRDKAQYGDKAFKKVIAQQVEAVYPLAVSKHQGFVPTIYSTATFQKNTVGQTVVTLPGAHSLKAGDRVRVIGETNGTVETEVLAVPNAKSFAVALPKGETKLFVYGPEVADLRTVDYEAISMLNVSATQELAKQVADLKAQNAKLTADNASLKASLGGKASASTLDEMQAALQALRAEVQTLKAAEAVASSK